MSPEDLTHCALTTTGHTRHARAAKRADLQRARDKHETVILGQRRRELMPRSDHTRAGYERVKSTRAHLKRTQRRMPTTARKSHQNPQNQQKGGAGQQSREWNNPAPSCAHLPGFPCCFHRKKRSWGRHRSPGKSPRLAFCFCCFQPQITSCFPHLTPLVAILCR